MASRRGAAPVMHDHGVGVGATETLLLEQLQLVDVLGIAEFRQLTEPVAHRLAVLLLDGGEMLRTFAR